jgi:hypothetical protein
MRASDAPCTREVFGPGWPSLPEVLLEVSCEKYRMMSQASIAIEDKCMYRLM